MREIAGRNPMPAVSGVDAPNDIRLSSNYFRCAGREWLPQSIDDPFFPSTVYAAGREYGCRYEPAVNRTYEEMAAHYSVAVVPARPMKPRDKACASYCTLSRFDSGQDWLGRSSTAVPFSDCCIPKRF